MSESTPEGTVTFVLTGPRKGFTGYLNNGRYGFKDGKLTVPETLKDPLKVILCNRYACNIQGEAPIWDTDEKGASVKVGKIDKPKVETTTVKSEPVAKVVDGGPKVEPKS